jgi:glutamyl/glutaminyl-tRNA synthetase
VKENAELFARCAPASSGTESGCSARKSTWRQQTSTCATPVSHSLCTLEFEDHRPLYDWFLDNFPVPSRPRQYEFARLGITYTVLSKRALTALVRDGHVAGWDDPRMPTAGPRRRGVPPRSGAPVIRRVGVSKANSTVDDGVLDAAIRDVLNELAPRRMAVLKPLKLTIENYPAGRIEEFDAPNHPGGPGLRDESRPVLPRGVHRARRLSRGATTWFPARCAGPRGEAPLRLPRHLP